MNTFLPSEAWGVIIFLTVLLAWMLWVILWRMPVPECTRSRAVFVADLISVVAVIAAWLVGLFTLSLLTWGVDPGVALVIAVSAGALVVLGQWEARARVWDRLESSLFREIVE